MSEYTGFGNSGYDYDGIGFQTQFTGELYAPKVNKRYKKPDYKEHEKHQIHRRYMIPLENNELIQHVSDNTHDFVNDVIGTGKKFVDVNTETEHIQDDPIMNKYANLANESYNHYEGKPKQVNDFKKVNELNTNINNVVMESKDEVHMSFRGTMNRNDWFDNNAKILSRPFFGDIENTARYKEAENQLLKVIEYAKTVGKKLTLSGHSLGGNLSYEFSQMYDISGYHFEPAISMKQIYQQINKTFESNVNLQRIFRTHADLPSIRVSQFHNLFKESNDTIVNHIGTKTALDDSLVKTHSIEHFTENISQVRNTATGSILKSLSTLGALGIQGYFTAKDIKKDKKTNNPITNSTIDVLKNVGELLGGIAIGSALGPELFIPALISGALFNVGVEHLAHEIKTTGVQDANVIKKAFIDGKDIHGKNIGNRIKQETKQHNKDWEHRISKAGKFISNIGKRRDRIDELYASKEDHLEDHIGANRTILWDEDKQRFYVEKKGMRYYEENEN